LATCGQDARDAKSADYAAWMRSFNDACNATAGDLASHDYDCLSQEQLAPARNGMRELSALEPGQQVPDLRHASLPPVRPPVRTSKVIVDGLRQATVREASRRMHHLNPAGLPCDLRLRRSTNQS